VKQLGRDKTFTPNYPKHGETSQRVCNVNIPESLLMVSLSTGLKCLTQLIAGVSKPNRRQRRHIQKNDY